MAIHWYVPNERKIDDEVASFQCCVIQMVDQESHLNGCIILFFFSRLRGFKRPVGASKAWSTIMHG